MVFKKTKSFLNCNTCDNLRRSFGPTMVWSIATLGESAGEGGDLLRTERGVGMLDF